VAVSDAVQPYGEDSEMTNFRSKRGLAMLAGAGLLLALSFSPASAQRPDDMRPGQGGGQNPCVGDAQRLCSAEIPDRSKVASCLFKNKRSLTPACRAELGGGGKKAGKSRKGKRHGKRARRR
jgi:hypothetical protein